VASRENTTYRFENKHHVSGRVAATPGPVVTLSAVLAQGGGDLSTPCHRFGRQAAGDQRQTAFCKLL
jgi:hypothetical protein